MDTIIGTFLFKAWYKKSVEDISDEDLIKIKRSLTTPLVALAFIYGVITLVDDSKSEASRVSLASLPSWHQLILLSFVVFLFGLMVVSFFALLLYAYVSRVVDTRLLQKDVGYPLNRIEQFEEDYDKSLSEIVDLTEQIDTLDSTLEQFEENNNRLKKENAELKERLSQQS